MRTGITVFVAGMFLFTGISSTAQEARKPTLEVRADLELFYELSDDVGGLDGDHDRFRSNQLYVDFLGTFEKKLSARLLLDGADIVSGNNKLLTEKIVEEANFTASDIGGSSVNVTFGKSQMPFGMDVDRYLNDSINHMFEIDKVWGIKANRDLCEGVNVAVGLYENRNSLSTGQTLLVSDNEITDNVATKVVLDDLVSKLDVHLSFSRQSYGDIEQVDEVSVTGLSTATVIERDTETRWGVGVNLDCPQGHGNINLEYVSFSNFRGIMDYDTGLFTMGAEWNVHDPVDVYGRWEIIDDDAPAGEAVENNFWTVGIAYTATENYILLAEYSNFNSANLKAATVAMAVPEGSIDDALLLGVKATF